MRTTSKKHRPKVVFFGPPEKPIYNVVYFKIKLDHLLPPILVFLFLVHLGVLFREPNESSIQRICEQKRNVRCYVSRFLSYQ